MSTICPWFISGYWREQTSLVRKLKMKNEKEAREYILELYKIVSPTSVLVVNPFEKVKRLHCPFRVIAFEDIPPDIIMGDFYMVDYVKMALNLKEVFILRGKGYYIHSFQII